MNAVYRFSTEKAFSAIHWMVSRGVAVDLHAALKTCYFADKSHINEHFQPIFGATYRAMKYGPVPIEIYEMMQGSGILLWEVKAGTTPWSLNGYQLQCTSNSDPDMSCFAQSELEHFEQGFKRSTEMNFTARTAATHGRDWQAANGGTMLYEDMIDDTPNRSEIIRTIKETAAHIKL